MCNWNFIIHSKSYKKKESNFFVHSKLHFRQLLISIGKNFIHYFKKCSIILPLLKIDEYCITIVNYLHKYWFNYLLNLIGFKFILHFSIIEKKLWRMNFFIKNQIKIFHFKNDNWFYYHHIIYYISIFNSNLL